MNVIGKEGARFLKEALVRNRTLTSLKFGNRFVSLQFFSSPTQTFCFILLSISFFSFQGGHERDWRRWGLAACICHQLKYASRRTGVSKAFRYNVTSSNSFVHVSFKACVRTS
jgi:hypothetical protein